MKTIENLTKPQLYDQIRQDEKNIEKIMNWEKTPINIEHCIAWLFSRVRLCNELITLQI